MMPKDPTKNVDRYKVRGGDINEFEYNQNQGALAENKASAGAKLIPGTPPEKRATKKAAKKSEKKAWPSKVRVEKQGASAKKLAARKAATKKTAKKK
jgi:hypothetical protein